MKIISIIEENKRKINKYFYKNKALEIIYFFGSVFLTLITCVPPFRSLDSISASQKGYYYANYFDLGFIKRGLMGTIVKILHLPNFLSPSLLVLSLHIIFLISFSLIFWTLTKSCFKGWTIKDKIPFYTLFTLSPVLFLRLGFDIGRMDLICLVLSIAIIMILLKNSFSDFSKSIFITLSISIQLLIHEASLLYYTPLIVCLFVYKYKNIKNIKFVKVLSLSALPIFVFLNILIFGRYEPGLEQLNTYFINISQELDTTMNVELIHTLKDSFEHALPLLTLKSFFGGSYLITIYYFFIIYLLFRFTRIPLFLKLSVFSPLLLSFIARDDTRFLAVSTICCNLLFLISANESKLNKPIFFGLISNIFLIFIFLLGPWGIGPYDPLPLLKHYNF